MTFLSEERESYAAGPGPKLVFSTCLTYWFFCCLPILIYIKRKQVGGGFDDYRLSHLRPRRGVLALEDAWTHLSVLDCKRRQGVSI
mgnify:FL=1